MKKLLCVSLALGILAGSASASTWMTSWEKAKAASAKSKKPILALFTGSDWCPPCKALEKDVFAQKAFSQWASKKVILLMLDFPRNKKMSEAQQKQNQTLAERYKVPGYPTVLFLSSTGKVLGNSGYMDGGPSAWTKHADQQLKKAKGGR